jgi:hypothetical protein
MIGHSYILPGHGILAIIGVSFQAVGVPNLCASNQHILSDLGYLHEIRLRCSWNFNEENWGPRSLSDTRRYWLSAVLLAEEIKERCHVRDTIEERILVVKLPSHLFQFAFFVNAMF